MYLIKPKNPDQLPLVINAAPRFGFQESWNLFLKQLPIGFGIQEISYEVDTQILNVVYRSGESVEAETYEIWSVGFGYAYYVLQTVPLEEFSWYRILKVHDYTTYEEPYYLKSPHLGAAVEFFLGTAKADASWNYLASSWEVPNQDYPILARLCEFDLAEIAADCLKSKPTTKPCGHLEDITQLTTKKFPGLLRIGLERR